MAFLASIIREAKYIARQPIKLRLLTALQTKQIEIILNGNISILDPLLQACQNDSIEISQQAIKALVSIENIELLQAIYNNPKATIPIINAYYIQDSFISKQARKHLVQLKKPEVIVDILEPLVQACEDADPNISEQAQNMLTQFNDHKIQSTLYNRHLS